MLNIITKQNAYELNNIKELYETAFPLQERREFSTLIAMLDNENMKFNIYKDDNLVIGIICYWTFTHFTFIEHIAVNPSQRGKQYGTKIIHEILSVISTPILLEVEPPTDTESIKRISFYNKLGFNILKKDYMQPPYDATKHSIPLQLMSNQNWHSNNLNKAINEIATTVYAYTKSSAIH